MGLLFHCSQHVGRIQTVVKFGLHGKFDAEAHEKLDKSLTRLSAAVRFAEERLQPRGSCHETEIFRAFRRSNARYREEEALPDPQLRRFIRNWAKQYIYPTAERTGNGYFKRISLKESVDPFTGARTGMTPESRTS